MYIIKISINSVVYYIKDVIPFRHAATTTLEDADHFNTIEEATEVIKKLSLDSIYESVEIESVEIESV